MTMYKQNSMETRVYLGTMAYRAPNPKPPQRKMEISDDEKHIECIIPR
jgi:hypothetical protein